MSIKHSLGGVWVRKGVRRSSTLENEAKKNICTLYIFKNSALWTLNMDITYQTDFRNLLGMFLKNKHYLFIMLTFGI